jgi:hypothetical protein
LVATSFAGTSAQAELDFAIPFFDEDIPLYLDPFLLWRSPSQQDQALHTSLINAFKLGVSFLPISLNNNGLSGETPDTGQPAN